jgi:hypothetical protein
MQILAPHIGPFSLLFWDIVASTDMVQGWKMKKLGMYLTLLVA